MTESKKPEPAKLDMTRLSAAKLIAQLALPYYRMWFYTLVPVCRPGIQTMGCDQWGRLYIDPWCLDNWSVEQSALVIAHEVEHLIQHFTMLAGHAHMRRQLPMIAHRQHQRTELDRFGTRSKNN